MSSQTEQAPSLLSDQQLHPQDSVGRQNVVKVNKTFPEKRSGKSNNSIARVRMTNHAFR